MRLYTFIPFEVYEETLAKTGRYVCDHSKLDAEDDAVFTSAYDWLVKEMAKRIGKAPEGVKYPVWAWYRSEYDGDNYHTWGDTERRYARVDLEIDDTRVVLTDFDGWHSVLNNGAYVDSDDWDEIDRLFEEIYSGGEEAVRASWQRIFKEDAACVQATFWELHKEDVANVVVFTSEEDEESED